MADNSAPSEKALTMADNSAEGVSNNAVGRDELRRVFAIFDKNGDGLISKQEMRESFDKLRLCIGEEELASTIRTVDVNGDGYVDFDEFVTLYESMSGKRGEEGDAKAEHEDADLAEAFGVFDENGDGLITVEELQSVLKSLGFEEGRTIGDCKKMIQKVDKDGDGMVNYMEFKEMMSAGFGRN
jgi:calcium-binding protein CML